MDKGCVAHLIARIGRALAAATGAAVVAQAVAAAEGFEFETSNTVLACLTSTQPERKNPTYPSGVAYETSAVVRVHLTFASSDAAPDVEVKFNNGPEAFADAVRDHVATYRLPCLPSGKKIVGAQEFQFVQRGPSSAVLKSAARNADGYLNLSPDCMAGILGAPPPVFPAARFNEPYESPGAVLVRITFTAPDQPPLTKILYDGGDRRRSAAVVRSVSEYRLRCMQPGDEPAVAVQLFDFRYQGDDPIRLKDELPLVQFLTLVKGIQQQTVRFDFTTMGCPFQVKLSLYQPYHTNGVKEVGQPDPNRREFVEWLRNLQVVLAPSLMKTTIGQRTTVSVPCVLLNLS